MTIDKMTSKDHQRWMNKREREREKERCSSHLYSWKKYVYTTDMDVWSQFKYCIYKHTDHILFGSQHQLCILNRHQCSSDLYSSETSKFTRMWVCLRRTEWQRMRNSIAWSIKIFSHLQIWDSLFILFYCWLNSWFPFNSIWWWSKESHIKQRKITFLEY